MRLTHFESLQPVCPHCKQQHQHNTPLILATILQQEGDHIIEAVLHCSDQNCQMEYPVIDGIPIIIADIRQYLSENFYHINARDDFSAVIESILGDAAGPATYQDSIRQQLSTYSWDHYADLDPEEEVNSTSNLQPGGIVRFLSKGLSLSPGMLQTPAIDIGCSIGRSCFELAKTGSGPVLGVDMNFPMLKIAQKILRSGHVSYPRRRTGIVYDRREFDVNFEHTNQVDFWCCDGMNLPFKDASFALVTGLNVIDSVASPVQLLHEIRRVLKDQGQTLLATPYDWSQAVTPLESWIGGHSQRGDYNGASEPMLRTLFTPGEHQQSLDDMHILAEIDNFPWHTRLHERSNVHYQTHLLVAQKNTEQI